MSTKQPKGQLVIQTLAMPAFTNANGDIFGGWLVSQMDLGAGILAKQRSGSRGVTVAIDKMVFMHPVQVGDTVCCYAELLNVGRTSMKINIEAWIIDRENANLIQVTEGIFTFVAIDENGKPTPVDSK